MKEASPCGLASFLSYLLWQVTEEVALLVKESSLQPQLAGRISSIPHLQVFLLVLLEDVARSRSIKHERAQAPPSGGVGEALLHHNHFFTITNIDASFRLINAHTVQIIVVTIVVARGYAVTFHLQDSRSHLLISV